ncbi:MAG: hypothetical protein KIT58_05690 [Planctomycetota bacterium]|nr:hypothetical protein [Planctomycetota bacterium]
MIHLVDALGRLRSGTAWRMTFRKGGVTFSVYSDTRGTEKIFPFDLVRR